MFGSGFGRARKSYCWEERDPFLSNTVIKGEKAVDQKNVVINAGWTLAYPNPRISTKYTFLEVAALMVWADKPKVKGSFVGNY